MTIILISGMVLTILRQTIDQHLICSSEPTTATLNKHRKAPSEAR